MDFNLIDFGKDLFHIRQILNLSLEEAGFLSDVNEKTIHRIEHGKNKISMSTLDKLSYAYKRDLFHIYDKHMQNPKNIFMGLMNDSEKRISIEDTTGIQTNLNKINKIPLDDFNSYERLYIKNYITLLESIYVDIVYGDRKEAINILIRFLKSQNYGFEVSGYKNFNYSPIERRILMNVSAMGYNLYSDKTSFEILCYLFNLSRKDKIVNPHMFFNLSTIYHYKNNYKKSFDLAKLGIQHCINSSNNGPLPKLFFRKFTCELFLGIESYKDSLNKAILLAEINDNDFIKDLLITNSRKFYNVSYNEYSL